MKVLVTGAFGWTAKSILEELHNNQYEIIAMDISKEIPQYLHHLTNNIFIGDVSSVEDVRKAMKGCHHIIHLAVAVGEKDYLSADIPFDTNLEGAYNIFEVAREFEITKIIMMSEAPVHVELDRNEIFSAEEDWVSSKGEDHLYDLTKRLQESIAKDYSETYDMNVIVLRSGHIVDGKNNTDPSGRNLEELMYCQGGWICRYDLAKVCIKALRLQKSGYSSFHVVGSWQAKRYLDVYKTEEMLKFKFQQTFEKY